MDLEQIVARARRIPNLVEATEEAELFDMIINECAILQMCKDSPLNVGFTQTVTLSADVAAGDDITEQFTIEDGHGPVVAYIITPLSTVYADLYDQLISLRSNSFSFVEDEPLVNFSTQFQNGTNLRQRGFIQEPNSRFSVGINNTSANPANARATLLFGERNTPHNS